MGPKRETVVRTVVETDYAAYLESEYPAGSAAERGRAADIAEHNERLATFPHSVVLQVSFAEMDYANRWCWQQFGPANGECAQAYSEYRACDTTGSHSHDGKWLSYWLAKTDYDFGFNEWNFAQRTDLDRFVAFVPEINWGERYPK